MRDEIDRTDARAECGSVDEDFGVVEPQTGIDRQPIEERERVLKVDRELIARGFLFEHEGVVPIERQRFLTDVDAGILGAVFVGDEKRKELARCYVLIVDPRFEDLLGADRMRDVYEHAVTRVPAILVR